MTAYAIWAPGVGYLTDERYPEDLPISKSNERRHVDDLNRAHVFLSLEAAYSALQVGYTKMAGI